MLSLRGNPLGSIDPDILVSLFLNASATLLASYYGYIKATKIEYLYNDNELYFIAGISKKIWFLLLITSMPLFTLLSKYTIINMYLFTDEVAASHYWGDILSHGIWFSLDDWMSFFTSITRRLFAIALLWGVVGLLINYGLKAIRDNEAKWRPVKIIIIFVIIPLGSLLVFDYFRMLF